MAERDITIPVGQLRAFTARNFEALGMSPEHADLMAEQIAWAHIRGYPWLGARKIIQYGTRVLKGAAATHGNLSLVTETDSLAAFDADNAFSQVIGKRAMLTAIGKARNTGVGTVVVRNSSNASALGYYAELAARKRVIGLVINNAPPLMAPWGSRSKILGNQAFAIGCPAGKRDPIILDTALSELTLVGIHAYQLRGEPLPEGVALDADGLPTTDPAAALDGILVPAGRHRGSGLAIMWEILTGVLAGGDRFMSDVTMPDVFDRPQGTSLFFLAIEPQAVMPHEQFVARVDDLVERIHASRPADGVERVRVPGEASAERARQAEATGAVLSADLYADLARFAAKIGVRWE